MPEHDLVGAAEAASIIGVAPPQITRWRDAGKLPPPAAETRATTVWFRPDIEAFARDGSWSPPPGRKARKPLDLVSTSDIAVLLDIDKSQVGRWRRKGKFPAPAYELRAGPLWWRKDVEAFGAQRTVVAA